MINEELLREVVIREHEKELAAIPDDDVLRKTIHVSPEFHRKIQNIIRSSERKMKIRHIRRKVASVFLAFITSGMLLCGINEDVRATCLRWIQTLVDGGMTEYGVPISENRSEEGGTITGFKLGYLPDGFELESDKMKEGYGKYLYQNGSKQLIFRYSKGDTSNIMVDNESDVVSHIILQDGTSCDYYESTGNKNDCMLIWREGDYFCFLKANYVAKDDLVHVAENLEVFYEEK